MRLSERLGIDDSEVETYGLVSAGGLAHPGELIHQACEIGPEDPRGAQVKLAAAALSAAQLTDEGRHAAALAMIAPLIADADPMMTLGPAGADLREYCMPNGWKYTFASWERLRMAWQSGGLKKLLGVDEGRHRFIVSALNEVTRMTAMEPEPVKVAIQEKWPPEPIPFAVTVIGLGFTLRGIMKERAAQRRRRR